jgi:hypothetical protein
MQGTAFLLSISQLRIALKDDFRSIMDAIKGLLDQQNNLGVIV